MHLGERDATRTHRPHHAREEVAQLRDAHVLQDMRSEEHVDSPAAAQGAPHQLGVPKLIEHMMWTPGGGETLQQIPSPVRRGLKAHERIVVAAESCEQPPRAASHLDNEQSWLLEARSRVLHNVGVLRERALVRRVVLRMIASGVQVIELGLRQLWPAEEEARGGTLINSLVANRVVRNLFADRSNHAVVSEAQRPSTRIACTEACWAPHAVVRRVQLSCRRDDEQAGEHKMERTPTTWPISDDRATHPI